MRLLAQSLRHASSPSVPVPVGESPTGTGESPVLPNHNGAGHEISGLALPAAETSRGPNILRLARTTDPASLDPEFMAIQEDIMLFPLLYLPLLDVTNGTQLVPCAARSWSASPDQRIFTLLLRPDVMFSNGRAVVAGDYVYALERGPNPAVASI